MKTVIVEVTKERHIIDEELQPLHGSSPIKYMLCGIRVAVFYGDKEKLAAESNCGSCYRWHRLSNT